LTNFKEQSDDKSNVNRFSLKLFRVSKKSFLALSLQGNRHFIISDPQVGTDLPLLCILKHAHLHIQEHFQMFYCVILLLSLQYYCDYLDLQKFLRGTKFYFLNFSCTLNVRCAGLEFTKMLKTTFCTLNNVKKIRNYFLQL
jgi:hypothetical protein